MDNILIECVPNFSEGQDIQILDAISDSIKSSNGVTLLGVDPGKSTNRTVYIKTNFSRGFHSKHVLL